MKSIQSLATALVLVTATVANAQESTKDVQRNVVSCRLIKTAAQLQAMRNNLAASYCLANDIDLASIANFVPIGDINAPFTGSFFGNNRVIRNLTISDSTRTFVGLFGFALSNGTIRDVSLVNVNVRARAAAAVGSVAGEVQGGARSTMTNISVSGRVSCAGSVPGRCSSGGVVGAASGACTLSRLRSAADVTNSSSGTVAGAFAGGLVGVLQCSISDSFATGNVSCSIANCFAGGLVGRTFQGDVTRSFATGAVRASGDESPAGGLVGLATGAISQSFASGPVSAGNLSFVGGLVGELADGGNVDQSFSIGVVGSSGGLIGGVFGGTTVTNSYWDIDTSGRATSVAGTGLTTAQLRAGLPVGFDTLAWSVNRPLSYPFLNTGDLPFTSPLATLVRQNRVYVFLPISQLDLSQYRVEPLHADEAALATVFTQVARAIGIARNVAELENVKIDRPFWNDATRAATFAGPVTEHATLGTLRPIGAAADLNAVVEVLDTQRLAILRGTFTNARGVRATHWMLATLYTRNGGSIGAIVANDPRTGEQVAIDPRTRKVLSPSDFPLANFTVNGFQAVAIR